MKFENCSSRAFSELPIIFKEYMERCPQINEGNPERCQHITGRTWEPLGYLLNIMPKNLPEDTKAVLTLLHYALSAYNRSDLEPTGISTKYNAQKPSPEYTKVVLNLLHCMPWAKSHLCLGGPRLLRCPHLHGNSSSLGTNVIIPGQKYKYRHHSHYSQVDCWS